MNQPSITTLRQGRSSAIYVFGQLIGTVSALAVVALATPFLFGASHADLSGATRLIFLGIVFWAGLVLLAALRGSPGAILLAFVVSFVPVGFYLLGNPFPVRWLGVAEIGYLLSAVLLLSGRPADKA